MEHPSESSADTSPIALGDRIASDLSFIRSAMERSGSFTAVPGWSFVFIGAVALVAAAVSLHPTVGSNWPLVWVVAASVAFPTNAWSLARKARRQGMSLSRGRGLRLLFGLCPPLIAGAVMTAVLWQAGYTDLLPEMWLLLYGAAVVTGGAFTVPIVPIMGAGFMLLGVVAWLTPNSWGIPLLAAGFGVLHTVCGIWIGIRHGG